MPELEYELIEVRAVTSLEEFQQAARDFSKHLSSRAVVALSAPLGAGKTEFVRAIAQARGFRDMASPTFAIHHRYQGFSLNIDHLDLYRLESEDELETTGFWDLFSETEGLVFIEWPERMDLRHIPFDWDLFRLQIDVFPDCSRKLQLEKRKFSEI